jgi:MYXO-CTERM domain-containing protein
MGFAAALGGYPAHQRVGGCVQQIMGIRFHDYSLVGPHSCTWSPWTDLLGANLMRKTLGISLTALTLLFGGAGVAHATENVAPVPATTTATTILAADNNDDGSDKTGLWGLAGLLGLIGLAGLKRRNDTRAVGTTNRPTNPGV